MTPSHAFGVREGVGEALTGARAGRAIEPRKQGDRGADTVKQAGRQHRWRRYCEPSGDPARSENQGMCGILMRENREVPCLARRVDHRAGRSGNAEAVSLGCMSMGSLTVP
jgi:hypothetical protein